MVLTPLFTWTSVHAILAALAFASSVLGGGFWYLMRRINRTQDSVDDVNDDVSGLITKVETLWAFAFGREDDATDGGIAEDIEEGFENVREDIDRLEKKSDTFHKEETEQIRNLVDALHDEDKLDFERDDVYNNDD